MATSTALTVTATTGREIGSRESGRLRRDGHTPAVVYGKGMDTMSIAVDSRELRAALNTDQGIHADVQLVVDGKKMNARVHMAQKHPVTHRVVHVDFMVQ